MKATNHLKCSDNLPVYSILTLCFSLYQKRKIKFIVNFIFLISRQTLWNNGVAIPELLSAKNIYKAPAHNKGFVRRSKMKRKNRIKIFPIMRVNYMTTSNSFVAKKSKIANATVAQKSTYLSLQRRKTQAKGRNNKALWKTKLPVSTTLDNFFSLFILSNWRASIALNFGLDFGYLFGC